jgi:hypothetical protein
MLRYTAFVLRQPLLPLSFFSSDLDRSSDSGPYGYSFEPALDVRAFFKLQFRICVLSDPAKARHICDGLVDC